MIKKKCLIMTFGMALCSLSVMAQQPKERILTIDEMFHLATQNSKSIKVYNSAREASQQAVEAAKSQRLPDINASLSFSYLGDGYLWDRHFDNGMNIDMPHFGNNFSLAVSQVIYAGGAINGSIDLAELGQQMTELDAKKNEQEVRFVLTGYYLDLYKLINQIIVLKQNISLTEQVLRNMESRRQQGTALKNDITRYELQLEMLNLQLTQVEDACKIINHQLTTTLELSADTWIMPDTTLVSVQVQALKETDWQQMAAEGNYGLQQAALAKDMAEQKLKLTRSDMLPKVALIAEEHLDGPILVEVPVINSNFNYWFVGIGVQYNISSLYKSNRSVREAKINVRKASESHALAKEQVGNGVQASYVNFLTSFSELRTQEKSVDLANENYSVTANRYDNDLALLTDMLDASNMKLSAELKLVNARINVFYNYYKLKYITHSL